MELQPLTLEGVIKQIHEQAAKRLTPVILEARIAVTPIELTLLDLQATRPLEIIRF